MFRLQNNQGRPHEWNLHSEGEKGFFTNESLQIGKKDLF